MKKTRVIKGDTSFGNLGLDTIGYSERFGTGSRDQDVRQSEGTEPILKGRPTSQQTLEASAKVSLITEYSEPVGVQQQANVMTIAENYASDSEGSIDSSESVFSSSGSNLSFGSADTSFESIDLNESGSTLSEAEKACGSDSILASFESFDFAEEEASQSEAEKESDPDDIFGSFESFDVDGGEATPSEECGSDDILTSFKIFEVTREEATPSEECEPNDILTSFESFDSIRSEDATSEVEKQHEPDSIPTFFEGEHDEPPIASPSSRFGDDIMNSINDCFNSVDELIYEYSQSNISVYSEGSDFSIPGVYEQLKLN
ncbi:hypothetical protein TWF281_002606 [Arthrobotrys megalospora]